MNYKLFELNDSDQVVDLLNLCFPKNQITAKTFLWKHFDEFWKGQTVAFVTQHQGQIVGLVCFTPFEILINFKIETVWLCAVQACHPDFRRKGIVKELTLRCKAIIGKDKTFIGFSNAAGLQIDQNSKSINYQVVGQITRTTILPFFFGSKNLSLRNVQNQCEFKLGHFLPNNYIQFTQSQEFINWRYTQNPKVSYEFWQVLNGDTIVAKLIINTTKCFVEISQIWFADVAKSKDIFRFLATYFFGTRFKLTKLIYLSNNLWDSKLPKFKISSKLQTYLTVKSPNPHLLNKENWFIQSGNIL
jgi:Acetyltransferase (GNAT) domain